MTGFALNTVVIQPFSQFPLVLSDREPPCSYLVLGLQTSWRGLSLWNTIEKEAVLVEWHTMVSLGLPVAPGNDVHHSVQAHI